MNTKLKFLLSCASVTLAAVTVTSVVAQTAPAPSPRAPMHGKGFEALDTNKDTLISRDEAKGHRFLVNKFDAIDINKDGFLSRDELVAFRAAHKGQRGEHGKRGMHEGKGRASLDTNNDQLISRSEAKGHQRLEKHFDAIDSNKDGQLSRDELKAFRTAQRGPRQQ
ncbi:MAG: calcium sensor EFh [Burkholderiaceae bacterium]